MDILLNINVFCTKSLSASPKRYFYMLTIKLYRPFEDKIFTKYQYFGLHNPLASFLLITFYIIT